MTIAPKHGWPFLAAALAALFLAWSPAARAAEPNAIKAPASLEDQLQVLSSALSESFSTGDWEMLEMVADGVKAAGLKGQDLEVFALRGERDAALSGLFGLKPRIILWGLAFRAKLGNGPALAALREKALTKLDPVKNPGWPADGKITEAYKAWQQYQNALADRGTALLVLALLGEKEAGKAAWEELQQAEVANWSSIPALAQAVLAAEGQAGWKKLSELCLDAAADFGRRAAVLGSLAALAGSDRPANRAQAFKLEGRLAKLLPADAGQTLRAAFIQMAEKFPETDKPQHHGFAQTASLMPGFADDPAAVQALTGLKGRVKGQGGRQWDMTIDWILKSLAKPAAGAGASTAPEKPQPGAKETF